MLLRERTQELLNLDEEKEIAREVDQERVEAEEEAAVARAQRAKGDDADLPGKCSTIATPNANASCCTLRPRTTPSLEENSILGVIYGVLLWADMNAATPPGARGRSGFCADKVYKHDGWQWWGHWLGTGNSKGGTELFLPFVEALTLARTLRLASADEWRAWCKKGMRPTNVPACPDMTCTHDGWLGWEHWLWHATPSLLTTHGASSDVSGRTAANTARARRMPGTAATRAPAAGARARRMAPSGGSAGKKRKKQWC